MQCLFYEMFILPAATDPSKTFSVSPATVDLPPMKSMSFQVSFKPVSLLTYAISG